MTRHGYSELYDAIQSAFDSPEDMSVDRLATWMVRGESGKGFSPNTIKLAEKLSESKEIFEGIQDSKDFRELEGLKEKARNLDVHKSTVIQSVDIKINKIRIERLKKKGKMTTLYRDELKKATSEKEINDILAEALEEMGEGKNIESLKESGEYLKRRF